MTLSPVARADLRDTLLAALRHQQAEPDARRWVPALRSELERRRGRALAQNLLYRMFAFVGHLMQLGIEEITPALYDAAASAELATGKWPPRFDRRELESLSTRGVQ